MSHAAMGNYVGGGDAPGATAAGASEDEAGLPVARAFDLAAVRAEVLETAGKRGGTDGAQAEDAWSDWLGEVVVFLETSGETHRTAVDAAAGLIAYGATSKVKLARAAGQPPDLELFRRSLRGEGIRPAVSDLLWGAFVAQTPAATNSVSETGPREAQGAFGGPGPAAPKSVSETASLSPQAQARATVSDLLWGAFVAPTPAATNSLSETGPRASQGAFGGPGPAAPKPVSETASLSPQAQAMTRSGSPKIPLDWKNLNPDNFVVGQWVDSVHVDLKDKSGGRRAQVTFACRRCGNHTVRFPDRTVVSGVPRDRLVWVRNGDPASCAGLDAVGEEPCCGPQLIKMPALPDGVVRFVVGSKVLLTKLDEAHGGREGRVVKFRPEPSELVHVGWDFSEEGPQETTLQETTFENKQHLRLVDPYPVDADPPACSYPVDAVPPASSSPINPPGSSSSSSCLCC